ncbi:hypothetical protein CUT44_15100 [Streptomyces carminius]|uniref:Uncharacterized protein n=1 Tax=Streptomyces carminius TaxID=2665496 RepID=A0A2M8LY39_9ACTN|nr:hypothetical protein CUT44_15100 [Streptomyces carminius]
MTPPDRRECGRRECERPVRPAGGAAAQHHQQAGHPRERGTAEGRRPGGERLGPGGAGVDDAGVDEGAGQQLPGAAQHDHGIAAADGQPRPYGGGGVSLPGRAADGALQGDGPLEGG